MENLAGLNKTIAIIVLVASLFIGGIAGIIYFKGDSVETIKDKNKVEQTIKDNSLDISSSNVIIEKQVNGNSIACSIMFGNKVYSIDESLSTKTKIVEKFEICELEKGPGKEFWKIVNAIMAFYLVYLIYKTSFPIIMKGILILAIGGGMLSGTSFIFVNTILGGAGAAVVAIILFLSGIFLLSRTKRVINTVRG